MSAPIFNEAEQQEIASRIAARIGEAGTGLRACLVCGVEATPKLVDGIVFFKMYASSDENSYSGQGIPCVVLGCKTCGHTLFLNMLTLGLGHLVTRPSKESGECLEAVPPRPIRRSAVAARRALDAVAEVRPLPPEPSSFVPRDVPGEGVLG